MEKTRYRRRFVERIEDRDPNIMWVEAGRGYVVPYDEKYAIISDRLTVVRDADILLQTEIVNLGEQADRGRIVSKVTPSWLSL